MVNIFETYKGFETTSDDCIHLRFYSNSSDVTMHRPQTFHVRSISLLKSSCDFHIFNVCSFKMGIKSTDERTMNVLATF